MKLTTPIVLALAIAASGCGNKDDEAKGTQPAAGDENKDSKDPKRPPLPKTTKMVAKIEPKNGSNVSGNVWFEQGKNTAIAIQIAGLTPGLHGLQIMENGDCSADDGTSVGAPYNPTDGKHGKPKSHQFQVGDLGNIAAPANGKAERTDGSTVIKLKGEHSVVGRAVVVYAGQHDFRTHPDGAAGDIVGCGVIGPEE